MKITKLGIIVALKNIGSFLTSYTFLGIKADPYQFLYALLIFALISIPSDLFLLNHLTTKEKKE